MPRSRSPRRLASWLALAAVAGLALAPVAQAGSLANGSTYVLTSFDGTSLLGLNSQGKTFTAVFSAGTVFRLAALDKYQPSDPCRAAAAGYNNALSLGTSDQSLVTAIGAMAANGCQAKVILGTGSNFSPHPPPIKQFTPTPPPISQGQAAYWRREARERSRSSALA